MTNLLLAIVALTLVWALVLREPLAAWQARRAQRRRVLTGMVGGGPLVPAPALQPADESVTLLLCDDDGTCEHEITKHGIGEAPETWTYANKAYARRAQRADGAWEYVRTALVVALLLLLPAPQLWAQGSAVTLRRSDGTEIGVTAAPVRTDPTGTTVQPVSQSGNWLVQGLVAHDAVYSGNPLPTGCYASAAAPSDVSADGDMVRMWCLRNGALSVNITNASLAITAASLPLPALAATSTKQSDGSQKTQIVDGSGNVIASTSNNLNVQCANCSGSGASAADEASFTAGTSTFAPSGGFFQTTATNNALTTGQQGQWQMTANRAGFVNLRNASGTEIGTASNAVRTDPTGTTTQPVSQATASNLKAQVAQLASVQTSGTLQSAAVASGNGTPLSVDGYASAVLTVNCATCSGGTTVNFEVTEDGSNWQLRDAHLMNSSSFGSSTTTAGVTVWELSVAGFTSLRARISGYSAGTVTVTAHAVPMTLQSPAVEANIVAGSVSVSGTASTNVAQLAGTTTDTNSGTKSAGTLRVVLATDQPQLTNKLLVTPDANSAVNVAQINGVTPLMGTGNTGTGSQRVTIATDQAALAAAGQGATGAAVPSGAQYQGVLAQTALPTAATAGNLTGPLSDKFGRQVVVQGTIRDLRACQTTTISASTSETTIVTAAGASVFADPYLILVSNTSASTNTRIDFRDATAGTILFSLQSVGGSPPAGFVLPQSIPQTTANNNWTAQAATSTTDLRVYVCYEKNK